MAVWGKPGFLVAKPSARDKVSVQEVSVLPKGIS